MSALRLIRGFALGAFAYVVTDGVGEMVFACVMLVVIFALTDEQATQP